MSLEVDYTVFDPVNKRFGVISGVTEVEIRVWWDDDDSVEQIDRDAFDFMTGEC